MFLLKYGMRRRSLVTLQQKPKRRKWLDSLQVKMVKKNGRRPEKHLSRLRHLLCKPGDLNSNPRTFVVQGELRADSQKLSPWYTLCTLTHICHNHISSHNNTTEVGRRGEGRRKGQGKERMGGKERWKNRWQHGT